MSALIYSDDLEEPFRATISGLVERTYATYDSLREYMQSPWRGRPLDIQIVDDAALNAAVTGDGNADHIRINRGALEQTFGTMLGLFSSQAFLPEVGDPTAEETPTDLADSGFPALPLVRSCDPDTGQRAVLIPQDKRRASIAIALGELALEFLLFHEVGHVVGGHLELLKAYGSRGFISELGQRSSAPGELIFSHVLECDADAFACHHAHFVYTARDVGGPLREVAGTTAWEAEDFAMIAYLTAVGVLFRVLYPRAPVKIGAHKSSHPHPVVRSCLVASSATARALFNRSITLGTVDKILGVTVRNIEEVWAALLLPGQNPEPAGVWARSVRNGAKQLFTAWGKARQTLERHARLPRRWDDWDWSTGWEASI